MIKTLIVDNVDLTSGKIYAHDYNARSYILNYNDNVISRIPKPGDHVVAIVESSFAYIVAYIRKNPIITNDIHNFDEIYYYIDEINYFRLLKNIFTISLDKSQLKMFNNNFELSSDNIFIQYKNGYIRAENNEFEIACVFNMIFSSSIKITNNGIVISFKTGTENAGIGTEFVIKENGIQVNVMNGIVKIEASAGGVNIQAPTITLMGSVNIAGNVNISGILQGGGINDVFAKILEIISKYNTHTHTYILNGTPTQTSVPINQITQ